MDVTVIKQRPGSLLLTVHFQILDNIGDNLPQAGCTKQLYECLVRG